MRAILPVAPARRELVTQDAADEVSRRLGWVAR